MDESKLLDLIQQKINTLAEMNRLLKRENESIQHQLDRIENRLRAAEFSTMRFGIPAQPVWTNPPQYTLKGMPVAGG